MSECIKLERSMQPTSTSPNIDPHPPLKLGQKRGM